MATLRGVDWSEDVAAQVAPRPPEEERGRRWGRRPPVANPARTVFRVLALCVITTSLACIVAAHLVWNRTPSLPLGVYVRTPGVRVGEGVLVALPVPAAVRTLVHDRRYLPDGSLLIKPVAAVPGDYVCTRTGILFINGEPFGSMLRRDSEGRDLPVYRGCGALPAGQVFLASHQPQSFDSRSFGPVDVGSLQGTVIPLWTY
jgi:conjugative transfer signal peptidase TraF